MGSNTGMKPTQDDTHARNDQRLTNLEIKVSYSEDLLDTLNDIVTRQQDLIDHLRREVLRLRQQSGESGDNATPSAHNPADELPPHY